jgi:microcystin-dependent protein
MMSDQYIGEIRAMACNFEPKGWAQCDGRTLQISQYQPLYTLIGTTYGGDGKTTFALPDLRGRCAISQGTGKGLTPRNIGQGGGSDGIVLNANQIPAHSHSLVAGHAWGVLKCTNSPANSNTPVGNSLSVNASKDTTVRYNTAAPNVAMSPSGMEVTGSTENTGAGTPHNNVQPYTTLTYYIALTGLYPSMM